MRTRPLRPLQAWRPLIGEVGANVKVAQEQLGHHFHSFTADTYQHVIPGMDEAATNRFEELVFGESDAEEDPAEAAPAEAEA